MSNILMTDLEGVLIATALPGAKKFAQNGYGVRPYALEFVMEVLNLFDEVYLNTCVEKEKALMIMQDVFATKQVLYYPYDKTSPFAKASGYENISGRIFHLEDGSLDNIEAKRIISLGHIYLPISSWTIHQAYYENDGQDHELLKVLELLDEKIARL